MADVKYNNGGIIMFKQDRMTIVKALHSDHEQAPARKAMLDKALGIFNALFHNRKAYAVDLDRPPWAR